MCILQTPVPTNAYPSSLGSGRNRAAPTVSCLVRVSLQAPCRHPLRGQSANECRPRSSSARSVQLGEQLSTDSVLYSRIVNSIRGRCRRRRRCCRPIRRCGGNQRLGEGQGGLSRASVRVVHHAGGGESGVAASASEPGAVEGGGDHWGAMRTRHAPAQDPPRVDAGQRRGVTTAGQGPHVGKDGHPPLTGRVAVCPARLM